MPSVFSQSVHGIIWSAIERFSLQGVQFILGIILARLLSPADFGLIGMLSIFLSVSQTFIDCGFSNALIRQKDVSVRDYGTAFLVNLSISIVAFTIMYSIAPFVADFYDMPELRSVMRVISITLIINALFTVHKVRLTRNVDFKTQSKASFFSALMSGAIGVILAYNGFGVWSLVSQSICNAVFNLVLMTLLLKWFPKPLFDGKSFHCLFGFGSRVFVAGIISSIYSNLYNIVIGKQFSASNLGYYTRADQLGRFPSQNISGILYRVTYPILSQLQDDSERLRKIYIKYLELSCFFVFPMMMGLASLAKPIILLLLGEKWLPSVPLLQVLCFGLMLDPICNINLNLLYVKGRSDLVLKLEIIKKSIAVTILVISLPFGLVGLCLGRSIYGVFATLLNMMYTKRFIEMSMWRQVRLIFPSLFLSLVMAFACYGVSLLNTIPFLQLLMGVFVGVVLYLGLARATKVNAMDNIVDLIKKKL